MAITAVKLFDPSILTNAVAVYYTATARTVIKKLTFTNTDSSARTVSLYLVPVDTGASISNLLTDNHSIDASKTYEACEAQGQLLNIGDTIQVIASLGGVVNMQGAGVQLT